MIRTTTGRPGRSARRFLSAAFLAGATFAPGVPDLWAQEIPLLTERAATLPPQTLTVTMSGDAMLAEPNFMTGHERTRCDGPLLRVAFAPSAAAEFTVEWVAFVAEWRDADYGTATDWGDVSLRAKMRVRDGGPTGLTASVRLGVTLPETKYGQGLGPNALRTSLVALFSQPAGRFAFHANAGLAIHDEVQRPHEQRDFLVYALAISSQVNSRVELLAEWAGRAGRGKPGADEHSEIRAGLRLHGKHGALNAALRRGLLSADGTWGATLGATWRVGL